MDLSLPQGYPDILFFPERRHKNRFPLRTEVRYELLNRNVVPPGVGQTLNIGSGGVLFTTEQRLPPGHIIELSLNWPALLNGTCPLKLVLNGPILRSEGNRAAVRIERYEFRVRSTRPTESTQAWPTCRQDW